MGKKLNPILTESLLNQAVEALRVFTQNPPETDYMLGDPDEIIRAYESGLEVIKALALDVV